MIEVVDLTFAMDSIPAIFAVTQDAFIIFTSNVLAILGLRSLYFLLARAMSRFHYLRPALAVILIFIGARMLLRPLGAHSHSLCPAGDSLDSGNRHPGVTA